MASKSSSLLSPNTSSATSTSSTGGRNKVALKPGRSLMDWVRLTHSGKDLSSIGGKLRDVTPRELAKHNTKKDAWICLKDKVYNITPYLEFHPGGEEELMRGAGKDATDLFNQIHKWVNAESMLQKCLIGPLKKTFWLQEVPFLSQMKSSKEKHKRIVSDDKVNKKSLPPLPVAIWEKNFTSANGSNKENHDEVLIKSQAPAPRFDWTETENNVKLMINFSPENLKLQNFITDLVDDNFIFIVNKENSVYQLNIRMLNSVRHDYEVKYESKTSEAVIVLMKKSHKFWFEAEKPTIQQNSDVFIKGQDIVYRPCRLIGKSNVNHNTILFTFQLPSGFKMWVPTGYHIHLKSCIKEMEIVRSYTPVLSSLDVPLDDPTITEGSLLILMIKIYPLGTITPFLNDCSIGDIILISNYTGKFSEAQIEDCDSLVCIAAGTGITPMIKIIHWALNTVNSNRLLFLLFFNKTEEDILWYEQFKELSIKYNRFEVVHVLSEANESWKGLRGKISKNLLLECIPEKLKAKNQHVCICGPLEFTKSALGYLEEIGYCSHELHEFTG